MKLLSDNDPEPVTVYQGNSPVIFSSPHNGLSVPRSMPQTLGWDEEKFLTAHETHDLHIAGLVTHLQNLMPDANFITGTYSRLVADLNRMPDHAITLTSSEYEDIIIPENQPEKCTTLHRTQRFEEIYWPYHDAKTTLIEQTRQKHGGVIVIDLHSFTPTWKQSPRMVEIGTLRREKTPLSEACESFLKAEQKDYTFISGEPYCVSKLKTNAAPLLCALNDLPYFGIEVRSDLIDDQNKTAKMGNFLKTIVEKIQLNAEIEKIMARRPFTSKKKKEEAEQAENLHDTWSI